MLSVKLSKREIGQCDNYSVEIAQPALFEVLVSSLTATILIVTMSLCAIGGEHPAYPQKFLDAANDFKIAAATNRLHEANAVNETLPTTPVLSNGGPRDYKSRGSRFESRDYTKPSFLLTQSEVTRLLGPPSFTNSVVYNYLIAKTETNKSESFLAVMFHKGYVVESIIYSGPPQSPKK